MPMTQVTVRLRPDYWQPGRSEETRTASEKPFYGSWDRLLDTMFQVDIMFEVVPQFPHCGKRLTSSSSSSYTWKQRPSSWLKSSLLPIFACCRSVETRTPTCVSNLSILLPTRCMGYLRLALRPPFASMIGLPNAWSPENLKLITDTAPREWWAFDVLEEDCAKKWSRT